MVAIDFGDFSGIDMLDSGALGGLVFTEFDGFDFRNGAFDEFLGMLEIPSTSSPDAYVLAYGAWAFGSNGIPSDESTIYAIEVWDSSGYRVVIDGFDVFFPTLRDALENNDLSSLYAGHALTILGHSHDDTLSGGSRNDELYGYGGADVLFGNGGSDYLDGKGGADTMAGGRGRDDYAVNHAGDVVEEADGEGIDFVVASIDYTLPPFVEDLGMLDADGALDGTGNSERNFMAGNASANALRGLEGNDTLIGARGADLLEGGNGDDSLLGGGGADSLVGDDGADFLRGGDGKDTLTWDALDDKTDGGSGTDTLLLFESLDLTVLGSSRLANIEKIDMTGGAADSVLTLDKAEVLAIGSGDKLTVLGDEGETVSLVGGWVEGATLDGFTAWTRGMATVRVEDGLVVI